MSIVLSVEQALSEQRLKNERRDVVVQGLLQVSRGLTWISDHPSLAAPSIGIRGDALAQICRSHDITAKQVGVEVQYRCPIRIDGILWPSVFAGIWLWFSHIYTVELTRDDGGVHVETLNERVFDLYVSVPASLTEPQALSLLEYVSAAQLEACRRYARESAETCVLEGRPKSELESTARTLAETGLQTEVRLRKTAFGRPLAGARGAAGVSHLDIV
jgi:hypothetical protein